MSGAIVAIVLITGLGVGAYLFWQNKCTIVPDWFPDQCGNGSSTTNGPNVDPSSVTSVTPFKTTTNKKGKAVPHTSYKYTYTNSQGITTGGASKINPAHHTVACDGNGNCPTGFLKANIDGACMCHWANGVKANLATITNNGLRMSFS